MDLKGVLLQIPGADDRLNGDGDQKSKLNTSGRSRRFGKNRVPPEGREKNGSAPSSAKKAGNLNLSCGDAGCKDSFCRAQNNNHLVNNVSNLDRETSIDSISVGPVSNVSMIGLIRGAREVRRLIREASFDSTASEFSLGVSIAEDLCDADNKFGEILFFSAYSWSLSCSNLFYIRIWRIKVNSPSVHHHLDPIILKLFQYFLTLLLNLK